jgi:hypothetical protein
LPAPDSQFGGASRCQGSPFLLCDDFEAQAVGARPAATWNRSGSVVVDNLRPFRGAKSAHFKVGANRQNATLTTTKVFPADNNTFYLRMFVYFENVPPTQPLLHFSMAWATGPFPSNGQVFHPQMRALGAINRRVFMNEDGGPEMGEFGLDDTKPPANQRALPEKTWVCYEMMWKGDTGEMDLWWDDVEHPSLHLSATNTGSSKGQPWPTPQPYQSLSIGMTFYQTLAGQQDIDMFIDEVAIDKQRIGCAK